LWLNKSWQLKSNPLYSLHWLNRNLL
jgi:hypothetical protein